MKLSINPNELEQILKEGKLPEHITQGIQGMLLAMAIDGETDKAVRASIDSKIKDALDAAIVIGKQYYGNRYSIEGWASEKIKAYVSTVIDKVNLQKIIREECGRAVEAQVSNSIQDLISKTIKEDVELEVKKFMGSKEFSSYIAEKISNTLIKALK